MQTFMMYDHGVLRRLAMVPPTAGQTDGTNTLLPPPVKAANNDGIHIQNVNESICTQGNIAGKTPTPQIKDTNTCFPLTSLPPDGLVGVLPQVIPHPCPQFRSSGARHKKLIVCHVLD